MQPGDKVLFDFGEDSDKVPGSIQHLNKKEVTLKKKVHAEGWFIEETDICWLYNDWLYPKTHLFSGSKVLLDFSAHSHNMISQQHLNKTEVTLTMPVFFGNIERGWYIEEDICWFRNQWLKPLDVNQLNNVGSFCVCSNPNAITNFADGNSFLYCRRGLA